MAMTSVLIAHSGKLLSLDTSHFTTSVPSSGASAALRPDPLC